ncbi:hypothetical protein AFK24_26145 [Pseudomonas syringae]|uniref:Uncharacterized protein n=1 Tax=Pseudomonas syringae TaxID=317 RepID=A0A1C7YYS8_PSESX|nr:hypothetical protein AFK24_26145 [Pseudomonas syringae]
MLSGFATMLSTGWVVVAQQPLERAGTPLRNLTLNVIGLSAPFVLFGSLMLWWLTLTIRKL